MKGWHFCCVTFIWSLYCVWVSASPHHAMVTLLYVVYKLRIQLRVYEYIVRFMFIPYHYPFTMTRSRRRFDESRIGFVIHQWRLIVIDNPMRPWMMVGLLFDVRWRVFWREIGRFGGRLMTRLWNVDNLGVQSYCTSYLQYVKDPHQQKKPQAAAAAAIYCWRQVTHIRQTTLPLWRVNRRARLQALEAQRGVVPQSDVRSLDS